MKRSGRVSPLIVIGIACVLLIIPLLVISGGGPETTASDFMVALGSGNADKLADLSVIGNLDRDKRKELWDKTLERGKHYVFTFRITNTTQNTPDTAVIEMWMRRNLQLKMGTSEDKFQLPMVKKEGKWKVDVLSMNREIYPALPRP